MEILARNVGRYIVGIDQGGEDQGVIAVLEGDDIVVYEPNQIGSLLGNDEWLDPSPDDPKSEEVLTACRNALKNRPTRIVFKGEVDD